MTQSPHSSPASPKLSLFGASVLGVASMLGAGVFIVFSPAAKLSGSFLFLAVVIAALIAGLNARSMMQLASVMPGSGGAYRFAQEYLSKTWGFIAGFAFVIGKIGSVAAIALVVAGYLFPEQRLVISLLSIIFMTLINLLGINRTALGALLLSIPTVLLLGTVIAVGLFAGTAEEAIPGDFSWSGVLGAAALIFFAFAGYARVATLGDEIKNPSRNVPRAISIALLFVLTIYLLLALALQRTLGESLVDSLAPVLDFKLASLPAFPAELVIAVAVSASLGSMLALLAGISRMISSMAQDGELPRVFARLSKKHSTPYLAEIAVASSGGLLLLTGELSWVIGLSSCAVLTYYSIANLAAFRQGQKLTQRALSLLGFGSCLLVALFVPLPALVLTAVLITLSLIFRWGLRGLAKAG